MLYAVPIGILAGLALGGRLQALGAARLRLVPLFMLALAIQVALFSTPLGESESALSVGPLIYVATDVLVVIGLLANLGGRGVLVVIVGALCNLLVITANGGKMPVSPEALYTLKGEAGLQAIASARWLTNVTLIDARTQLGFLGDVFPMPGFIPYRNVFSIGDAIVAVGVALWIVELMRAGTGQTSREVAPPALATASERVDRSAPLS